MSDFSIEKKIYYHDTDTGGVVYYSNYFKYMEEARTEYLSGLGIDVADYMAGGILFAVVHLEADYKSPARYGDKITVSARIDEIGNASIHFTQEVKKADAVLVSAKVVLVCISDKMKARRVPEDLKEKYNARSK
ncbi:MAG: YbgC/FadM family acyl-CoA thioesterase [Candidatus Omnitrophica bacterium]|nr:YbgC/FadM family acyl-CoA thioesterase [Candidatus Omnitrophota bacterium]